MMPTSQPIAYVIDDDISVLQALSSLIRALGWSVRAFASGGEFLQAERPDAPSCLVLDVMLADGNGLDFLRDLEAADVQMPIIFMTGHGTIPMTVRAMKAGAIEFLTKPFQEEELIAALQQAIDRDRAARRARAERAAVQRRLDLLTAREREVLDVVVTGRPNKQIAAELGIAEQTVKQHRGRVMRKLGAGSMADLVRLVAQTGAPTGTPSPASQSTRDVPSSAPAAGP
jgi:RNA polymerase sigma factor (sigma-70 family)